MPPSLTSEPQKDDPKKDGRPGSCKMAHSHNRRRYPRFDAVGTGSFVRLTHITPAGTTEEGELLNFSSGGMCIQVTESLQAGMLHRFQLHLKGLLEDTVSVTAEVKWVHALRGSVWRVGVQFISSDKAYFGPQEDEYAS